MSLEPELEPPMRRTDRQELGSAGRFRLVRDRVAWVGGESGEYVVVQTPDSAFMVPVDDEGLTTLVRQWRYPWDESSWEVPAGTLEAGEEPLAGARRELVEETGLEAQDWTPLGAVRGSAVLTGRQHLFLARGLRRVPRAPEPYERDLITRRLDFREALDEALGGGIRHAGSIAALTRAARSLRIL